jgi:hypothetical protein
MRRHLVRLFVALFTFTLGLAVAGVSGVFNHRAQNPPYRKFGCQRTARFVQSPSISIDNEPNQPLKVLYSSTSIDPAVPDRREVHFIVENRSSKDVAAYAIKYHSTGTTGLSGPGISLTADSPEQILRVGESQPLTISCDADELLTLWVDSAEFADGLLWSSAQHVK